MPLKNVSDTNTILVAEKNLLSEWMHQKIRGMFIFQSDPAQVHMDIYWGIVILPLMIVSDKSIR